MHLCAYLCHDSTCTFLIVMLILMYAFMCLFEGVECFNVDVCIFFVLVCVCTFVCFILAFRHVDIDVYNYNTCIYSINLYYMHFSIKYGLSSGF